MESKSHWDKEPPIMEAKRLEQQPKMGGGNLKFRHSGDMGDIIFSLCAIKAVGGGTLYLDIEGGVNSPIVSGMMQNVDRDRVKFDKTTYEFIRPVLMQQPYIRDVQVWKEEMEGPDICDLDCFRTVLAADTSINLAEAHLRLFKINDVKFTTPWLKVEDTHPGLDGKILVARNLRYQSSYQFWEANRKFIEENGVFVGLDLEYQAFCNIMDIHMPRIICTSALDICRAINGAKEVWANQGLIMTLALAMGATFVQEWFRPAPYSRFNRKNGYYV